MPKIRVACLSFAVLTLAAPVRSEGGDRAALTAGVESIGVAGVPGPLCVFGEDAFVVVAGQADGRSAPLVAAGRWGRGRVVAFGHNGYLTPDRVGAGPLFANSVRWVAGRGVTEPPPRVATWRARGAAAFLAREGFPVEEIVDPSDPGEARVLVLDAGAIPGPEAERAIAKFVREGGGLVAGSLGWGWLQLNPGRGLATDHPGNRLLADAGIAWADGTLEPGEGRRFAVGPEPAPLTHAGRALARLAAAGEGLGGNDAALAAATVIRAVRTLPPDAPFRRAIDEAIAGRPASDLVPTARRPLGPDRPFERVLLAASIETARALPPERVRAHPAAGSFPGSVPKGARPVTRTVAVDTAVPDWTSTGLYAAPGAPIRISLPPSAVGAGLAVRIGAHSDRNWHHDAWKRVPEITRVFPLDAPRVPAANAFGGLVYVVVPRGCRLGVVEVEIAGAVPAPLFLAGRTDPEEWRREIRDRPGPWAEIGSAKMIVTVPSEVVRSIEDPTEVTEVWDRILDLDAELAGRPADRDRPERIVCDQQISAGYMHAGYPIMTWMDQVPNVVDPDHLRKGNWGLFHEVGHNHQSRDWTFGGTTEVTVNLFTLYVFDRLCGVAPEAHERANAAARAKHMAGYLPAPDFERWKASPFLALTMYVQLQQAFGWEAFRDVFAEYRALPGSERPQGDAERRDQWMIRFSRRAGRDLGPFFARWGIPVSEDARARVADLPSWMPEEMAE